MDPVTSVISLLVSLIVAVWFWSEFRSNLGLIVPYLFLGFMFGLSGNCIDYQGRFSQAVRELG
jgi:hypothetical protein